ncbi:tetratricopeptide repeat protein [Chryseobacterium sp. PBS4-4]|uniref:Tetratricopeptide repeat protein n=1 Tax=Chryseobacterium edaphi TaxID=2976532 RepID=A0ABT2W1C1_9FLAO|nr:tetratricopeptide repeat protein [Chryseobacterium edaphi]MCU7615810.1 tetratricopeptide repeat protein [Chryseobacterium edaphi]
MKKLLFFLLFLVSLPQLVAQKYSAKEIDSLIKVAEQNSDIDKAIAQVQKLYKSAEEIDYNLGKINCLNSLAFSYYLKGDNETAIQYSIRQEKEAKEEKEYLLVCSALRTKASCYSRLGLLDEAIKTISEAVVIADKITDTDELHNTKGSMYQAKQLIYSESRIEDSTLFYHKKALKEFLQIKSSKRRLGTLSPAYINLANAYTNNKKFDSAQYYFDKVLVIANKTHNEYNIYKSLNGLGWLYLGKKDYKTAIEYFDKAYILTKKNKDPYTLKAIYIGLQRSYNGLDDLVNKEKYLLKYNNLNDSLSTAERKSLQTSVKEIERKKDEDFTNTKTKFYIIFCLSALVIFICLYFVLRYFKNYQREKLDKFSKEETILEKESKLSQLESKINNAFEEVLELAKNDDPAFLARFKEVYPEFYNKLTSSYPDLTISQLRFCAMLRLNFSTKEIAHYHHTTVRGVQTKKTRLRKQLNLPSEEDLNKWMMEF